MLILYRAQHISQRHDKGIALLPYVSNIFLVTKYTDDVCICCGNPSRISVRVEKSVTISNPIVHHQFPPNNSKCHRSLLDFFVVDVDIVHPPENDHKLIWPENLEKGH